jgi:hypothetical protein
VKDIVAAEKLWRESLTAKNALLIETNALAPAARPSSAQWADEGHSLADVRGHRCRAAIGLRRIANA